MMDVINRMASDISTGRRMLLSVLGNTGFGVLLGWFVESDKVCVKGGANVCVDIFSVCTAHKQHPKYIHTTNCSGVLHTQHHKGTQQRDLVLDDG